MTSTFDVFISRYNQLLFSVKQATTGSEYLSLRETQQLPFITLAHNISNQGVPAYHGTYSLNKHLHLIQDDKHLHLIRVQERRNGIKLMSVLKPNDQLCSFERSPILN